jgi:glycosyltransferase involved in cell wall biosynthesis
MLDKKITVMMPAYNEEQDLPVLLGRIQRALEGWANYRILIVDDGSRDNTAQIVRDAAADAGGIDTTSEKYGIGRSHAYGTQRCVT